MNLDLVVLPCGGKKGFTLVEILVVMGIIVLLIALVVPTVTGISSSSNLNNAGRLVSNLLTLARSEAINRRTIVRVEIATTWPTDPTYRYRKATLTAALDQGSGSYNYRQITSWETLADGIIFEVGDPLANAVPRDGSKYFLDGAFLKNTNATETPKVTFGGNEIATVYLAFLPSGALSEPMGIAVPIRARLTEGVLPAGSSSIIYTRKNSGSGGTTYPGANWFDIRINPLIGRIEIGRPDYPLQ